MSMRAAKIRFRKKMRAVGEIEEELEAILNSLPHPTEEELKRARNEGISLDLHFMGALYAVTFYLSEAGVVAGENDYYMKSRRQYVVINDDVLKGLAILARPKFRLPPMEEE